MNFFVNRAMGIGNSGVEHAQFYRAARFEQADIPYRFIFTELVNNLHEAMDKWHLANENVISMWEYFVLGDDYLKNGVQKKYKFATDTIIDSTDTHRKRQIITSSGLRIVEGLVKYPDRKKPKMLLVSTSRMEIFDMNTNQRKVMYQLVDDPHRGYLISNIHLFDQHGKHLFFNNETELQRYFFKIVDQYFGGKSVFIIDRGEATESTLLHHKIPNTKVIDVVHADHLSDRDDPKNPLWNNFYEYALTHTEQIDRLIVATKMQREDLLVDFPNGSEKIVTIPVGGVSDEPNNVNIHETLPNPVKFVTISRLASEKHIDLIVKAVAQLNRDGHPASLDIYGQGEEKKKLQTTIEAEKAEKFVTLKGLTDHADQVYPEYDAFVSASFSEGFGLTYIEALSAALPIVTFKARFGAIELVEDGINGFLQDFKRTDEKYNVKQLVKGMERLLASDYAKLQANTRKSVVNFKDHVIAQQWRDLINAL